MSWPPLVARSYPQQHRKREMLLSTVEIQKQPFHILEPENRFLFKRYCLECYLALCQLSAKFGYKTCIKIVQP
jgi:hypothetical protein